MDILSNNEIANNKNENLLYKCMYLLHALSTGTSSYTCCFKITVEYSPKSFLCLWIHANKEFFYSSYE